MDVLEQSTGMFQCLTAYLTPEQIAEDRPELEDALKDRDGTKAFAVKVSSGRVWHFTAWDQS